MLWCGLDIQRPTGTNRFRCWLQVSQLLVLRSRRCAAHRSHSRVLLLRPASQLQAVEAAATRQLRSQQQSSLKKIQASGYFQVCFILLDDLNTKPSSGTKILFREITSKNIFYRFFHHQRNKTCSCSLLLGKW